MKKLIVILGCLLVSSTNINAQQACEDNGTGSVNGTHTDPANATPVSSGYKTNTFDWTLGAWPFFALQDLGCAYQNINSPFVQTDAYLSNTIAKGLTHSDFLPKDGWELIKQDFGYYYGAGTWNGGGNLENALDPHNPTGGAYDAMAYMLLYNKYTGVLRVIGSIPAVINNDHIYVHLAFTSKSGDNVSALFDHYNNPATTPTENSNAFTAGTPIPPLTRTFALDQTTTVTDVGAVAAYPDPTGCASKFFFADFQTSYDPCVCIFQQGLHVYFEHIQTASIKMTGTFAGVANQPISNVSVGTGSSWGDGSTSGQNFIASVFASGNSPQAVMQSYNNIGSTNGAAADATDAQVGTALESFGLFVSAAIKATLTTAAGVPEADPTAWADLIGGIAKGVEFFGMGGSTDPNVSGNEHPMLLSGYTSMTGNVTTTQLLTGFDDYIAIPGSPETVSGQPTEYSFNNGTRPVPAYPMYNEPLGTFALLKTPVVNQYAHFPNLSFNSSTGYFGTSTGDLITFEYNPAEDLVYALNPVFDVNLSKIFVNYEIDGCPIDNGNIIGQNVFGYYSTNMNYLYDNENYMNFNENGLGYQNFYRNATKMVPISCNTQIYTKESYAWLVPDYGNCGYSAIPPVYNNNNPQDGFAPNNPAWEAYEQFSDIRDGFMRVTIPRNVTLVVSLYLVSKPDVYGQRHLTSQIMKYNCKVNETNTNFGTADATGEAAMGFPNNQNLNTPTTYNTAQEIYSFGIMDITASQTNNTPSHGLVKIVAAEEIDVNAAAGSSVAFTGTGNISLYTQETPDFFTTCSGTSVPPLTGANLTSYCSSGGYNGSQYLANTSRNAAPTANNTKGNPSALAATPVAMVQTKLGTDIKLGIFPNPTSGVVYLNLSAQNAGNLIVNLSDATGNAVMHTSYPANVGANSYKLDLSTLNSGVYFINITDENGVTIKNDKLVLMGQ